jgi:low temperature requirement protein LtrA
MRDSTRVRGKICLMVEWAGVFLVRCEKRHGKMAREKTASLLRVHVGAKRVTTIELFFDLVYVFAITQLSHHLLGNPTWEGAWQTLLLLSAVWLVWVYTAAVTNYLDPERLPLRLLLLALMLLSLVMSAALPTAFGVGGLVVASAYATMQIGRTIFAIVALRGEALQVTFVRLLAWNIAIGCLWLLGAFWPSQIREGVWALAIGVDLFGAAVGFYVPGLGRSRTWEWTIEGSHFAERCQAFILIALGESIVVIGASLASLQTVTGMAVAAFVVAFVGSVALWWIYFDRSAEASARLLASSRDPGRLARSAYVFIHPIMIAGIIAVAAADDEILARPEAIGETATTWMILGGAALFLAGHALFKAIVWRVTPWSRIVAIILLALLGLPASHISALALGVCVAAVVVGVAVADRLLPSDAVWDEPHPAHT